MMDLGDLAEILPDLNLLIDSSDMGKYGAFSQIGSNENFDRLSQGPVTFLSDSKQIQDVRGSLLERFNSIPDADLTRIRKVLPDNVDNVRLVLEISRVASEHGLILRDVRAAEAPKTKAGTIGPSESPYGTIGLGVTVAGPYRSFVGFLEDIEKALRSTQPPRISINMQ